MQLSTTRLRGVPTSPHGAGGDPAGDTSSSAVLQGRRLPCSQTPERLRLHGMPSVNKAKILALSKSEFIRDRENVLLVGNSGTGKTHLATALGIAGVPAGLPGSLLGLAVGQFVAELQEAQNEHRLSRLEKQWLRLDLVVLDELGDVSLSRPASELLFHFVAARYERGSLMITTNLEFSDGRRCSGTRR